MMVPEQTKNNIRKKDTLRRKNRNNNNKKSKYVRRKHPHPEQQYTNKMKDTPKMVIIYVVQK